MRHFTSFYFVAGLQNLGCVLHLQLLSMRVATFPGPAAAVAGGYRLGLLDAQRQIGAVCSRALTLNWGRRSAAEDIPVWPPLWPPLPGWLRLLWQGPRIEPHLGSLLSGEPISPSPLASARFFPYLCSLTHSLSLKSINKILKTTKKDRTKLSLTGCGQ